jgi:fatty acid desaturase
MFVIEPGEEISHSAQMADADRAAIRAIRQRASGDQRSRPNGFKSLLRGTLLLACLAPTTVLVLTIGSWPLWIAHWIVASLVLATIPSVYHEGTHRSLSRVRALNDGIATVAAALQFVPFATWRYFHLAHHANTGTKEDSEAYSVYWSKWMLITFPFYQYRFIGRLWKWAIGSFFHRGPRWIKTDRQIRAVRRNTAITLVVIALAVASCVLYWRIVGLLVAPCVGGILIASVTIVPEHFPAYQMGRGELDQLDRTGTYVSNPLTRLIMWNSNFHAAHHFAPKVPAHYLPRLDSMLIDVQPREWRWSGYFAWYAAQLRSLPWRPPVETAKTPAKASASTSAIVGSAS